MPLVFGAEGVVERVLVNALNMRLYRWIRVTCDATKSGFFAPCDCEAVPMALRDKPTLVI
jgi:hypothetical protein